MVCDALAELGAAETPIAVLSEQHRAGLAGLSPAEITGEHPVSMLKVERTIR